MEEIKLHYEVYRFKKWWKSTHIVLCLIDRPLPIENFEKTAQENDLWEIRNLTFEIIN